MTTAFWIVILGLAVAIEAGIAWSWWTDWESRERRERRRASKVLDD